MGVETTEAEVRTGGRISPNAHPPYPCYLPTPTALPIYISLFCITLKSPWTEWWVPATSHCPQSGLRDWSPNSNDLGIQSQEGLVRLMAVGGNTQIPLKARGSFGNSPNDLLADHLEEWCWNLEDSEVSLGGPRCEDFTAPPWSLCRPGWHCLPRHAYGMQNWTSSPPPPMLVYDASGIHSAFRGRMSAGLWDPKQAHPLEKCHHLAQRGQPLLWNDSRYLSCLLPVVTPAMWDVAWGLQGLVGTTWTLTLPPCCPCASGTHYSLAPETPGDWLLSSWYSGGWRKEAPTCQLNKRIVHSPLCSMYFRCHPTARYHVTAQHTLP